MDEKKFLTLFAEILETEEQLRAEDKLEGLEGWDSLAALSLLSMVDEEYNVTIGSKDIEKMVTIRDILDFIKSKSE